MSPAAERKATSMASSSGPSSLAISLYYGVSLLITQEGNIPEWNIIHFEGVPLLSLQGREDFPDGLRQGEDARLRRDRLLRLPDQTITE